MAQKPLFVDIKFTNTTFKRICWFVFIISLFILFEQSVVLLVTPKLYKAASLIYYLPEFVLFYLNTYYVLKLWQKRFSRILLIAFWSALEILAYCFICLLITSFIKHLKITSPQNFNTVNNVSNIWRGTYIWLISLTYWLHLTNIRSTKEIARLAIEKAETEKQKLALENAMLRSMVNPHFISNSLNSVYSLAEPISAEISKAIYNISEFVHYSYATKDGKLVELGSLEGEIEQIRRCIILRTGYSKLPNLRLNIDIDCDIQFMVPLMLLVSFVENIFHHGDLSNPEQPAIVIITLNQTSFQFRTENLIKTTPTHQGSGIGLGGAQTRLHAYYPNRFSLTESIDNFHHTLNLKIDL